MKFNWQFHIQIQYIAFVGRRNKKAKDDQCVLTSITLISTRRNIYSFLVNEFADRVFMQRPIDRSRSLIWLVNKLTSSTSSLSWHCFSMEILWLSSIDFFVQWFDSAQYTNTSSYIGTRSSMCFSKPYSGAESPASTLIGMLSVPITASAN